MRSLTYEELAAAYELRHGYETPTPWKYIAREFGVDWVALISAITRLERRGLNRDVNGKKPRNKLPRISDDMLEQVDKARRAGNKWDDVAAALDLPLSVVRASHWRWQQRQHNQK